MTPDQAIAALKDLQRMNDPEEAHIQADRVLCSLLESLGHGDVVAEWDKIEMWYA